MDYLAVILFVAGVAFGFIRRGREDRLGMLEVVVMALFLSFLAAIALSLIVLENVEFGEISRTSGLIAAVAIYFLSFVIGTMVGDFFERLRD